MYSQWIMLVMLCHVRLRPCCFLNFVSWKPSFQYCNSTVLVLSLTAEPQTRKSFFLISHSRQITNLQGYISVIVDSYTFAQTPFLVLKPHFKT